MAERILSVELNLEEGNLMLIALAECPFKTVFELIGKLNQQANTHFVETVDPSQRQPFIFKEQEMLLILKALGKLPYEQVYQLLTHLNKQIESQPGEVPAGRSMPHV